LPNTNAFFQFLATTEESTNGSGSYTTVTTTAYVAVVCGNKWENFVSTLEATSGLFWEVDCVAMEGVREVLMKSGR